MRLTNLTDLPAASGWRIAPCFNPLQGPPPLQPASQHRNDYLMIDHEEDNGKLEAGDPEAIERALGIYAGVRAAVPPRVKLGWYGFPTCLRKEHVQPYSKHYASIVAAADWIAPCCYVAANDPKGPVFRADLNLLCMLLMGHERKPRFGCVCETRLGDDALCTDDEIRQQVEAAMVLGPSLYHWSGLPYLRWAATRTAGIGHPAYEPINRARGILLGTFGFCIDDWRDEEAVLQEYRRIARRERSRFARALRDVRGVS